MKTDIIVSYKSPYHEIIKKESFSNVLLYNKFTNWISGEFDLFLQDKSNHLKIFFPNAQLQIKKITNNDSCFDIEIHIKTKVLNYGFELIQKITSVHNNLLKIQS